LEPTAQQELQTQAAAVVVQDLAIQVVLAALVW
jgi:hypothetical protein